MARPRKVKRILNVEPSRDTERDWRMEHARDAGALPRTRAAIPSSKDLREPAWWKIGDQGATGSCVGWATGDSVLRWHFVKAGRMAQDHRLSPRFIWMASKETDNSTSQPTTFIESAGTTLKGALDVARKFGTVHDNILPFTTERLYLGQSKTFYAVAARLKIGSYFNLSLGGSHDLDDWRTWIATKGPILTRLDVDRTWDDARANKGNMDVYRSDTTRGGHAVALVGYTPDRFIVRNSWGTTGWGDQGFGYASLGYAQDAFTEAYGVSL
jgi:Papain family cysteine protease